MALLAHVSTALGAGKITGLTLNLPAVKTCALETIRVTGTGRCSTFTVQLGDSTAPMHVPGDFPIRLSRYSKQGTYTPTAQGQGNCSGTASALLQVVGPSINSMFHAGITSGAGSSSRERISVINRLCDDALHGLWGPGDRYSAVEHPVGRHLRGRSYPAVSWAVDQPVTFTVVAQCGAVSNAWTANFTATRDFELLQFNRITCTSFPGLSASDQCQNVGGTNWPWNAALTVGTEPAQPVSGAISVGLGPSWQPGQRSILRHLV